MPDAKYSLIRAFQLSNVVCSVYSWVKQIAFTLRVENVVKIEENQKLEVYWSTTSVQ